VKIPNHVHRLAREWGNTIEAQVLSTIEAAVINAEQIAGIMHITIPEALAYMDDGDDFLVHVTPEQIVAILAPRHAEDARIAAMDEEEYLEHLADYDTMDAPIRERPRRY
jgi:hypothetical protein